MRLATFNVLADAYTGYGDYSHTNPELMQPGARLDHLYRQINNLNADVIGIQEADKKLVDAFNATDTWQTFWAPKGHDKPDGCLMLVKNTIEVEDHESHPYTDESGHIYQLIRIGSIAIANTHIKWADEDDHHHIGASQTQELLAALSEQSAAVILADCNGQPGGKVQTMVEAADFTSLSGEQPTAIVNGNPVAIDLLAIKGLKGTLLHHHYNLHSIPSTTCASDHIPLVADLSTQDSEIAVN